MPMSNPDQGTQGGDVGGMTKTDVVMGSPVDVAKASFEPGYHHDEMAATLKAGYVSEADLKQGYCDYGIATGEESSLGKSN